MREKGFIKDSKVVSLLNDIEKEIQKIYGNDLKDIILYGSYAKETNDNYSDIDIMILLKKKDPELKPYRKKLIQAITDISLKYDVVISAIDKNFNEFSEYAAYVPFYKNVFNEGIEIYAS
ncbi:MAG: nucleotidyltransferase domain-containing protein [bacterium]